MTHEEIYNKMIGPLRKVARDNGYALAVHGSLKRDIDLVAVPWTMESQSELTLVDAIVEELSKLFGFAQPNPKYSQPELKPHGRLAWSIVLGGCGDVYLDISVVPTGSHSAFITQRNPPICDE